MTEAVGSAVRTKRRALTFSLGTMLGGVILLCVQLVLLEVGLVRAQGTLDVCSGCTYESIQEAIDAADPGDTIRVAQGVYTENLVITKSLALLGGYESTEWSRDIELYETTIDGNRSGSVISVTNGCSTTIDGFTITRGQAERGGGIYIEGAAVSVTSNRLWDNMAGPSFEKLHMDRPLLHGDTVVAGKGDPSYDPGVYLRDETSGTYLGSGEIQADGRFTVTVSVPLVQGHVIWALGESCDHDEAIVESGEGSALGSIEQRGSSLVAEPPRSDRPSPLGESEQVSLGEGGGSSWLGGAVYALDAAFVVSGNLVASNTAVNFGGGIFAQNSLVTIEKNEITDNSAGLTPPCSLDYGYGGGVAVVQCGEFSITDNDITGNRMLGGGGGIYITDSVGSVAANRIIGNDALEGPCPRGGGVYVGYCSPVVEGNQILSNTLGVLGFPVYQAYGGGAYLLGSSATVTDNVITGNRVEVSGYGGNMEDDAQGGGIFAGDSPWWSGSCSHQPTGSGEVWPVIVGNHVEENSVESPLWGGVGLGGGLSAYGVSVTVLDNEIMGNTAGYDGAGVSVFQHCAPDLGSPVAAVVRGNQIVGNVVRPGSSGGMSGGLVMGEVTGTVENNVIADNLGGALAGGLAIYGPWARVTGNEITRNGADAVGGVYATGPGELQFADNSITGNVGKWGEGGIDVSYGSFVLSHNEIMSNTGVHGGGIAVGSDTTTVTLDANSIIANHATKNGGAVLVWPDTVFTLTNNVIAENSAEEMGGGICISNSQGSLINNTIAGNGEGAGQGVYLAGTADATILNNIIVSHTYGVYNAGSGTPDATYNDVWGNSVGDYFGVAPGVGNISSDPRFVDPDGWNYHLWLYSPAVDAGHPDENLAPAWDIDGDGRPLGIRVDTGADEVPWYKVLFPLGMKDRLQ